MKFITPLISMLSLTLCILPSRAQIIDDFSGTTAADSVNYNTLQAYGAGLQTFSISGGQLDPIYGGGSGDGTTAFLRNTGQSLSDSSFGQSVSIVAVNVNDYALAGLRFSTSNSSLVNDFEVGILGYTGVGTNPSISATTGNIYLGGTLGSALTLNFTTGGSVTETFTRVSDTLFDYSFAGPGLTGTFTGSFTYAAAAGQNIYFGPDFYANGNSGAQIEDNLAFNPAEVPEPSTYAMMFAGLAFLGVLIRRKGGQFNS